MKWLPFEFSGARSPAEAVADILVIARAPSPFNETHLWAAPIDGGTTWGGDGGLAVIASDPHVMRLGIDGHEVFELVLRDIRGAWLRTLDGADYYSLKLDLGAAILYLSDAYNGL